MMIHWKICFVVMVEEAVKDVHDEGGGGDENSSSQGKRPIRLLDEHGLLVVDGCVTDEQTFRLNSDRE